MLRGETKLTLREETRIAKRARSPAKTRVADFAIAPGDEALWEALREARRTLAEQAGVPPYVVFHDATLKEFVRVRPDSPDAMLGVHGVGQAKLDRYGEAFLSVIAVHPPAETEPRDEPATTASGS